MTIVTQIDRQIVRDDNAISYSLQFVWLSDGNAAPCRKTPRAPRGKSI